MLPKCSRKDIIMKKESKTVIMAVVAILVINAIAQAIMPAGDVIMMIASIIVMIGAHKYIKTKEDSVAEKTFRKIGIAFTIYQLFFGSAPMMIIFIGIYIFCKYYRKSKKEETTAPETETEQQSRSESN